MREAYKSLIRASLIVLFILFAFVAIAAAKAPESTDEGNPDYEVSCDDPPDKINSLLDLPQFEVDESITGSTPYWIFLVAGKDDKKQLLEFIKRLDLPNK